VLFVRSAEPLREALYHRYPEARRAFLKSGGDFPFLSRADEVNLHLLLHLKRVGAAHEGPSDDDLYAQQLQEQHEEERTSSSRAPLNLPGAAGRGRASGSGSGSSNNLQEVDHPREHEGTLGRSQSAGREDLELERAELAEGGAEEKGDLLGLCGGPGPGPPGGRRGDPLGVSSLRSSLDPWSSGEKQHGPRTSPLASQPGPPGEREHQARPAFPQVSAVGEGSGHVEAQDAKDVDAVLRSSWGSDAAGAASMSSSGSPGPGQAAGAGGGVPAQGMGFSLSSDHEDAHSNPQSDADTPSPQLSGAKAGLDPGDAQGAEHVDMGSQAERMAARGGGGALRVGRWCRRDARDAERATG